MKNLFTTLLFLLILVPYQSIQAQSPSPKRAAETFYRAYLNLKVRGLPNESQMKVLSPLITAELQDLFIKATEVQVKYKQENPDDKPPWADGDLFTSLFEGAQSFRVGQVKRDGDRAEVTIRLTYRQGGSTTRWSDVLVLKRTENRWLVWDILMKAEWGFKSGDSLRSILSSD